MRVCIFGAGSVGGYVAARLLKATGHEVSVVARGEQLHAIRDHGLRLITPTEDFVVHPHALTDDARSLPAQQLVFVTLKAQSQPAAAADIAHLIGRDGSAVFASNGVPWWWNHRGAARPGEPLPLLDPEEALWQRVHPARALGCVIYSANEVIAPGVVRHAANNRWVLGEPGGTLSPRLQAAVDLMREAGLNAQAVDDIRTHIWAKLLRNAPLNSVCALTRQPVNALAASPDMQAMCSALIDEVAAIAAASGVDLSPHLATAKEVLARGAAIDGTVPVAIRPSMLQDVLQGRRMEVEPILGQLQAFARETGTATPILDVLVPLIRALDLSTAASAP